MKTVTFAVLAAAAFAAYAENETFDATRPGALPEGWEAGVTGKGAPRWAVDEDPTAPSPPHVLHRSPTASSR